MSVFVIINYFCAHYFITMLIECMTVPSVRVLGVRRHGRTVIKNKALGFVNNKIHSFK